jgi:hypothetical protein
MRIGLLAAVALLAACSTSPPPEPPPARSLNATIRGNAGSEQIRAAAQANTRAGKTAVGINLAGGMSGATHPWHVHVGRCETNGPIAGAASAYPPLRPDGGGNASATANLDVELMSGQSYYINVHESPQNLGKIIACGDLR